VKTKEFLIKRIIGSVVFYPVLIWVLVFNNCVPKRYTLNLDVPGFHHSIRLKFSFKNDRERQSGKIVMKFDSRRAKILFLSPLNQVYFKLLVENNRGILINTRERKYWEGGFDELLKKMWEINLCFDDLKQLIHQGVIPRQKLEASGFQLKLEKDRESGNPTRVILNNDQVILNLKILNRRQKKGTVQFYLDVSKMTRSEIEQVLIYD
jgi:hypothetical protein